MEQHVGGKIWCDSKGEGHGTWPFNSPPLCIIYPRRSPLFISPPLCIIYPRRSLLFVNIGCTFIIELPVLDAVTLAPDLSGDWRRGSVLLMQVRPM